MNNTDNEKQKADSQTAEHINQLFWDEVADVHYRSYDLNKLRSGGLCLDHIQLREAGDVSGKNMLHLQCHIGSDTLSWARLGAKVTGVDFSAKSLKIAQKLRKELNLNATFIHSNVYNLPNVLQESFDIVYTSKGVLCWLRDLKLWGKIISSYLKSGGFFYIMESHPFVFLFKDEKSGPLEVLYSYFGDDIPTKWEAGWPDYADGSYRSQTPTYEWTWTMADMFNSLISAGLRIEFLHEYDRIFYKALPDMVADEEGWWYLPSYKGKLPFTFTLRATKD